MDKVTLFKAYKAAEREKDLTVRARGQGEFGIVHGKDEPAAFWQRRDRLSRKLDRRILIALGSTYQVEVCVICGWTKGICYCESGYKAALQKVAA